MDNQPYNQPNNQQRQPYYQPPPPQPNQIPPQALYPIPPPKRHNGIFLLVIVILLAAIAGTYYWQHNKVDNLQKELTASTRTTTNTSTSSNQDYLYMYKYGTKIPLSTGIQDLYYVDLENADGTSNDELSFSTQSLANADFGCLAEPDNYSYTYQSLVPNTSPPATGIEGSPFGIVTVSSKQLPANQVGSGNGQFGTLESQANGYYFYYVHPQGTCEATLSNGDPASATTNTLIEHQETLFLTALKDIKPIN